MHFQTVHHPTQSRYWATPQQLVEVVEEVALDSYSVRLISSKSEMDRTYNQLELEVAPDDCQVQEAHH
jgi:hypothetical protein